jgi:hypothetical protein
MAEAVITQAPPRPLTGGGLLGAAAAFWFFVTLVGQWVFLYYIVAFYGPSAMSGDFASWNRHPMAGPLYVEGDVWGNIAFGAHVLLAVAITFGGTLQLIPQIRNRAPVIHRWNGRIFIVSALLAALAGLYMVWVRHAASERGVDDFIISGNAVLILLFGALAWRAGAARNIPSHRRWALRMFMVTNGVFFLRIMFSGWIIITRAEPTTLTFYIFAAASYLAPLAVLQVYFWGKDGGGAAKLTAAGVVFASAAYMAIGLFGFYMIFVQRILGS